MMTSKTQYLCRVGTRMSPLAKAQTNIVIDQLRRAFPDINFVEQGIQTLGDTDKSTPLHQMGGKGVFIKALEQALISGDIDIAVHSAKDMTAALHPSLCVPAVLKPEAIEDCLVFTNGAESLESMRSQPIIGTSSLRRRALLKDYFSDLILEDIRGNVQTRIQLAEEKKWDAVMLSEVGLRRLNLTHHRHVFSVQDIIPAPTQGMIALQVRSDDQQSQAFTAHLNHPETYTVFEYYRYMMERIGFNCEVPFGLHIEKIKEDYFSLSACISTVSLQSFKRFSKTFSSHQSITCMDELSDELNAWHREHG